MPPKRTSRNSAKAQEETVTEQKDTKPKRSELQELNPQRVFLIPDGIASSLHKGTLKMMKLPHPRTQTPMLLLVDEPKLYEINAHSTEGGFCSFLIDQTVEKLGKIHSVTPFDARFLVLEKLKEADKTVELSDLFEGAMIPVVEGLDVEVFADVKEVCDRKLSRYNEERALAWLEKKIRRLAETLASRAISCGANARSKLLVKDEEAPIDTEEYIQSSYDLVCEYVNTAIAELLAKRLGIDRKRALKESTTNGSPSGNKSKRVKLEEPTENYATDIKPVDLMTPAKLTSAQKKLAQCDKSGMKSISSFFSKAKPKVEK